MLTKKKYRKSKNDVEYFLEVKRPTGGIFYKHNLYRLTKLPTYKQFQSMHRHIIQK